MSQPNSYSSFVPGLDDALDSLDASVAAIESELPTKASASFTTIAVAGQSNVVADTVADTLTLVAGPNVTITTNPTTDSVQIEATSGGVSDGDKGDITVSGAGATWTIDNDVVSNAKLANVATSTIKGRVTAGLGDPEDLTGTQVTALLDTFTTGAKGLVPASGGGTANFLRADGTFAAPPSGGLSQAQVFARAQGML